MSGCMEEATRLRTPYWETRTKHDIKKLKISFPTPYATPIPTYCKICDPAAVVHMYSLPYPHPVHNNRNICNTTRVIHFVPLRIEKSWTRPWYITFAIKRHVLQFVADSLGRIKTLHWNWQLLHRTLALSYIVSVYLLELATWIVLGVNICLVFLSLLGIIILPSFSNLLGTIIKI
jgi:hypothetical protein